MSARSPYFVSSLGHALFLGMLLTLAAVHRPPSIIPGVKIVALSGRGRLSPVPPAPRAQTAPAEKLAPPTPPAPVVVPKEKAQKTAPPERRPERSDPNGTKPPAPREIVSKAPSEPKPAAAAPVAPSVAPSAAAAGSGRGEVGIEADGETGVVSGYLALLRDKVAAAWQPPAGIGRTGEALVTVSFSVERAGGQPVDLVVQSPSGVSVYDLSAQRAVFNAAPLPPLPSNWPHDSIGIRFTFQQAY